MLRKLILRTWRSKCSICKHGSSEPVPLTSPSVLLKVWCRSPSKNKWLTHSTKKPSSNYLTQVWENWNNSKAITLETKNVSHSFMAWMQSWICAPNNRKSHSLSKLKPRSFTRLKRVCKPQTNCFKLWNQRSKQVRTSCLPVRALNKLISKVQTNSSKNIKRKLTDWRKKLKTWKRF